MPFLDDEEFKAKILANIEKYPETPSERILKKLIFYVSIVILAFLLFFWDESNKAHEIIIRTTTTATHKLMTKKAAGNRIFVETSRYIKRNSKGL